MPGRTRLSNAWVSYANSSGTVKHALQGIQIDPLARHRRYPYRMKINGDVVVLSH